MLRLRSLMMVVVVAACGARGGVAVAPEAGPRVDDRPRYRVRAVDCGVGALELGDKVGAQVAIRCPAGCVDGSVWGTEVYTSDSMVCLAAIHAGAATAGEGGDVMVEIVAGQAAYQGSARHGVMSGGWGAWTLSFRIESLAGGLAVEDGADEVVQVQPPRPQLSCQETAAALGGGPGTRHLLDCPAGCASGSVWGSGIYTDDSAICVAAVHAGVATPMAGGPIVVTIFAGLPAYQASSQNGVTTGSWAAWKRSYRVERR